MKTSKRMKKVFSILLCLLMVLILVPTTAFAAEDGSTVIHTHDFTYDGDTCACGMKQYPLYIAGNQVVGPNGAESFGVTAGVTSGTVTYNPTDNVLTLKGAIISSSEGYGIKYTGTDTLNLLLENSNTVSGDKEGIWSSGGITISGEGGTVTAEITQYGGCGIYGETVTINSGTVISKAISGSTINITGGTVKATVTSIGKMAISGSTINITGGTVEANANVSNSYGIYSSGTVTISGGKVTASATSGGNGGIKSTGTVTISGGDVTASGYDYGINADVVSITGGTVKATAEEKDGIYSSGTVTISGGKVTASANGTNSYGINAASAVSLTGDAHVQASKILAQEGITLGPGWYWNGYDGDLIKCTANTPITGGTYLEFIGDGHTITGTKDPLDYKHILSCSCGLLNKSESHKTTYSASGATITEKCSWCNAYSYTFTVSAQSKSYDGNPVVAQVSGVSSISETPMPEYYQGQTKLDAAPSGVGDYTAKITLEDVTASVDFSITIPKATFVGDQINDDWYRSATLGAPDGYTISVTAEGTYGTGIDYPNGIYESFTYYLKPENSSAAPVQLQHVKNVKVDGTYPILDSVTVKEISTTTATIEIVATDAVSGVKSCNVSAKDESVQIALVGDVYQVTGMKPGTEYNFDVLVKDHAGNGTKGSVKLTTMEVSAPTVYSGLIYTGAPHELFKPGTATGGTMLYSLEEKGTYSTEIPMPTATAAGDYTLWYYVDGNEGYADTTPVSVTATIAKKTLSVNSATIEDKTYDGSTDANVTQVTFAGMESTDVLAMGADFTVAAEFADANAGVDKAVTVTVTLQNTAVAKNYRLVSATADAAATITPKPVPDPTITLSFDTVTYTGQAHKPAVTVTDDGAMIPEDAYTVIYTNNVNAGTANVRIEAKAGSNYAVAGNKDFTIEKVIAKVTTAPAAVPDLVYDGTGQKLITAGETGDGKLVYSLSEDGQYAETIPTGTNATTYTVWYYVAGDANHFDSEKASVTVTINKAKLTITANDNSITYGDAPIAKGATASGFVNGESFGDLSGKLTYSNNYEQFGNVGTYKITPGGVTSGNYEITFVDGKLTVGAKPITEADVKLNGSFTYTGSEQTQPITVTDGITYEVTGNKATNAGAYELTVKGTGNYTGTVTRDWTIAKAKLTVTADSKVIYIGEKLPALTYIATGFVGSDKLVKEPALTTNADADQAGSYTITAANADAGENYTITYVSGNLTIMDKETEVETKIKQTKLTEVPDGLKNTKFNTVEAITEELITRILAVTTGFAKGNMVHYDVTLHFSLDGGVNWILATEENFPTEGITLTLPYPEGTNARDYEFVVSHMFTVTSQRLGTVAGEVEMPKVEETANGIRVTLKGLSPVTVAAKYHDHTGGTATCTDKAVCSICGNAYGELDAVNHAGGTEVKNAKDATCGAEGYTGDTYCKGCGEIVEKGNTVKATGEHTYGNWKVVTEPTKTTKGEKQRTCSICGHVDSEEIPMITDIPATGDDSNIMLYGSVFAVSLAGLVAALLAAKKRKRENA